MNPPFPSHISCPLCIKSCCLRIENQKKMDQRQIGAKCPLGEQLIDQLSKQHPYFSFLSVSGGETQYIPVITSHPFDPRLLPLLSKKTSQLAAKAPIQPSQVLVDQLLNTEASLLALQSVYRKPPNGSSPYMVQKKFPLSSPFSVAICAHRGDSENAPENTLEAFQKAVDFGVDYIELDVQLTQDKKVVVFHDTYLDRTTNGKGRLKNHTYQELLQYSAGEWFGEEYSSQRIPLLEEVLEVIGHKAIPIIEIKHPLELNLGIWEKILPLLKDFDIIERVCISTRSLSFGLNLKKETPALSVLHLSITKKQIIEACSTILDGSTPYWRMVTEEVVDFAHKRGKWLFPWTVDQTAAMKRMANWGVDGIITHKLQDLFEVLVESQKKDQYNPLLEANHLFMEKTLKKEDIKP